VVGGLATLGVPLWVDAGTSTATDAAAAIELGATTVVVGLETLTTFDALSAVCEAIGGARVAFSLDLRHGVPLVSPNGPAGLTSASDVARRAAAAGAGTVIVLDLARVGTGAGIDLPLMRAVRDAAPDVALIAGGGVRNDADLQALLAAGYDGALVATALLSGALDVPGGALYRDDRDSSRPLRGHPRSE
jgi:phosphoribosylformimino-5-aminoimidazole carboxamide ribotide isomerase